MGWVWVCPLQITPNFTLRSIPKLNPHPLPLPLPHRACLTQQQMHHLLPTSSRSSSSSSSRSRSRSRRRRRSGICQAELSPDAPFAVAIGASILSSFLFSHPPDSQPEDSDAAIAPTDARLAVMSIIAFIPFFNWLSWVFALMDTGERRYAVYAAVYLAPYLRTNLSLSPEESWLPIASIVLCVIHIQLEASIRNGDLDASAFFVEAAKRFGLVAGTKDNHSRKQGKINEGRGLNNMKLPSAQTQSRDEVEKWGVSRKSSWDLEHQDEDSDLDDGTER